MLDFTEYMSVCCFCEFIGIMIFKLQIIKISHFNEFNLTESGSFGPSVTNQISKESYNISLIKLCKLNPKETKNLTAFSKKFKLINNYVKALS